MTFAQILEKIIANVDVKRYRLIEIDSQFQRAEHMPGIVPLNLLQAGQSGEIVDIVGSHSLIARLHEQGVRRGSRLEALSPGDPFLFRVDETRLCLRSDGQVQVFVQIS